MRLKITDAGFAKLVNTPNTGTNAVLVTQIGLTSTAFTPSAGLTALPGEIKRVATFGGQAVGDDTVHVTIRDDSATAYSLRGFGLYLADGTLFASYGQPDPIMEKTAASMLLLATDTRFTDIDTALIQFGDAGFIYPPATTEVVGVVELATNTEAEDGADTQRALTPRGMRAYTDKRFGAAAPTALARTLLSAGSTAAARTALELKSAALKDTGHGNGLDADTLDGKHASEFALAGDFATVGHKHVISDVTGLQAALDGKASKAGNTFTDQQFIAGSSPLVGFGSAGAEQSFIGGWANTGLWRVWSADRGASSELTIKHGDGPRWNGSAMWHAGNFAPDSKINLTGGTFTGAVSIKSNSLRLSGWGNVATDGVMYFGSGDSYLFKSGSSFSLKNVEGGYTATLSSGGNIWTSESFNPTSKISRSGDTMSGTISHFFGATDSQQIMQDYGYADGALRWRTVLDIGGHYSLWRYPPGNAIRSLVIDRNTGAATFENALIANALWIGGDKGGSQGLQQFWNVAGDTNGYGCAEYICNYGGGTGGHHFYNRPNSSAALTRVMGVDRNGALWTAAGYDSGSSRKLKDIEGPIPYGLAEVEKMEIVVGRYKPEYNDDGRRRLFLVAEQLAELVPEAVNPEGVRFNDELVGTVKLEQLLPVAFSAIKELSAIVAAQGAQLVALKAER
ncbi:TPA: tail fiber domain-containing protein [Stenotrophomonas maltophilia]|nr:tail fiber domain-containing protein [Stenotrophomonas maltophilia]HDS0951672.1 tail fiber domain-containing protein [Stenotrophomonas maltophilia]HDS1026045.1 tail fiber domain-containing protein [Stenotrophomonas maltophilia]HDS1028640.1 tail fiber domain-containing protein [Stenotrophomonas maltophilia]HDS1032493.1 tail fiber domain-containing protein [Stenotrophomonas maltophilia]